MIRQIDYRLLIRTLLCYCLFLHSIDTTIRKLALCSIMLEYHLHLARACCSIMLECHLHLARACSNRLSIVISLYWNPNDYLAWDCTAFNNRSILQFHEYTQQWYDINDALDQPPPSPIYTTMSIKSSPASISHTHTPTRSALKHRRISPLPKLCSRHEWSRTCGSPSRKGSLREWWDTSGDPILHTLSISAANQGWNLHSNSIQHFHAPGSAPTWRSSRKQSTVVYIIIALTFMRFVFIVY